MTVNCEHWAGFVWGLMPVVQNKDLLVDISARYPADFCLGSNAHLFFSRYMHTCLFSGMMEDVYPSWLLEAEKRSCLLEETTLGLQDTQSFVGLEQEVISCASHSLKSHTYLQKPKRCVCVWDWGNKNLPTFPSYLGSVWHYFYPSKSNSWLHIIKINATLQYCVY